MPTDTLFSTSFILWVIASAVAASIFFGVINRRRSSLIESLRDFVDRYQKRLRKAAKEREAAEDPNSSP